MSDKLVESNISIANDLDVKELVEKAVNEALKKQLEELNKIKENEKNDIQSSIDDVINRKNSIDERNKRIDELDMEYLYLQKKLPNELAKFKGIIGSNVIDSVLEVSSEKIKDRVQPKDIVDNAYSKFFNEIKNNEVYYKNLPERIRNRIEKKEYRTAFEDLLELETNVINTAKQKESSEDAMFKSLMEIALKNK